VHVKEEIYSFVPQQNCYYLESLLGNAPVRIYCPLIIPIAEYDESILDKVTASGSCADQAGIFINSG